MMLIYALAFVLCIVSVSSQSDCGTTPSPAQEPCRRDIVIAIDGTAYMRDSESVIKEIDFVANMISNWTFGDNGVNVAIINFGFRGQMGFTQFFPNLSQALDVLDNIRTLAHGTLNTQTLTNVVQFVDAMYGTNTYPHRPGIEPRFIAFTATNDVSDLASAKPIFEALYNKNYDTVINVIFADVNLYKDIKTLKTIDMKNLLPQYSQNISDTIWDTLCIHDTRFTPQPCTTARSTTPPPTTTIKITTPAPVVTTTTKAAAVTTPAASGSPVGPSGGDGGCRCVPKHLWLDIVIVLDASLSIRTEGLNQLLAHVDTLFGDYMTIDPLVERSVRVALISTAEKATVVAHFDDIKSQDDLEARLFGITITSNDTIINFEDALQKASNILESEGPKRNNTRKVIIVYTSAFSLEGVLDPEPVAKNLLSSGVHIIGVKYNIFDEAHFLDDLSRITSPNMTFSNNYTQNPFGANLLNITVDALCWINCFCINVWNERKNPFTTLPKYGQCLYAADIDSGWEPASRGCLDMTKGSSLSFAKDVTKFDYYLDMFSKLTTQTGKINFHVGIHYNQSLNAYQYTDGSLVNAEDYIPWNTKDGYPKLSQGTCVAAMQGRGFSVTYSNVDCYNYFARYICEVIPCDTENYCKRVDVL